MRTPESPQPLVMKTHASRSARPRPWKPAAVLCLPLLAGVVHAIPQYDVTKTITWDVTDRGPGGTKEKVGANTGKWRYAQHAFAGDKHNEAPHDHKDNPQAEANPKVGVPLAIGDDGNPNGSPPKFDDHLRWSPITTFNQNANLALAAFQKTASSDHPSANSTVLLSTTRRGETPLGSGVFLTDSSIRLAGHATIHAPAPDADPHKGELSFASSFGIGEITLTGAQASGLIIDGKAKTVNAVKGNIGTVTSFRSHHNTDENEAYYRDPMSLAIVDSVTGDLLAEQLLYSELWQAVGEAGVSWDAVNGLTLTTGAGGSALFSMETLGSWVLNPFEGSASLVDGILTVTGDLALAWTVSTVDGITTANLAASVFDPAMTFSIQADGLGSPVNDIDLVFTGSGAGYAQEAQQVAEAGNLPPFLLGLVFLALVRRRAAKR